MTVADNCLSISIKAITFRLFSLKVIVLLSVYQQVIRHIKKGWNLSGYIH